MTGRTIGSYRIEERIGAGGMGEVYKAHDTKLDRPVALKLLAAAIAGDPDRLRRFRAEARAVSALNHPNILVIHDFGEVDGRPFIVSEFVEGQTLRARLDAGALPVQDALHIIKQVASALGAAHARGIVHRDIKPENVILRPDGYIKVLDFGLAKLVGSEHEPEATELLTQTGLVMGTPRYMSPEQARGHEVDARTDIWSAGVLLYELIAGRPPFSGSTTSDVIASILTKEVPPLPFDEMAAPATLADVVARALAKSRESRFASGAELHAAIVALESDSAMRRLAKRPKRSKAVNSLAVMPLDATSGTAEVEYLAEGITETVINALSQLPKLKVMARSTVFRFKGRDRDPRTIGRELGVRAVLLGRLQALGDHLVLRAELVDAEDGSHIWGGQFQRQTSDMFALQEELAQEIADQLRVKLTRDDRKRLQKRHTQNPQAYESYMRGRFQLAKRTQEGFAKAIESFDQAIAHDARYALAYAGLADCYTLLSAAAYGEAPVAAAAKARAAAEEAIRLDDQLAEAHSALGFVRFRIDWDWPRAEASLKRACELNPGHAPAHHRSALLLSALARHEEALAAIRRASELDPLSLIIGSAYGRTLDFAGRHAEAIVQLQRTVEMDRNFPQAQFDLEMAFAHAGRFEEAIAGLERQLAAGDQRSVVLAVLGHTRAVSGDEAEATVILRELENWHREGRATDAELAYVHVGIGNIEQAIDHFERAVAARVGLVVFLKVEPMADPLRSHPRFQSLLRRLGLA